MKPMEENDVEQVDGNESNGKQPKTPLTAEMIRQRAYKLYQEGRGGTADQNWEQAKRELEAEMNMSDRGGQAPGGDRRLRTAREIALGRAAESGSPSDDLPQSWHDAGRYLDLLRKVHRQSPTQYRSHYERKKFGVNLVVEEARQIDTDLAEKLIDAGGNRDEAIRCIVRAMSDRGMDTKEALAIVSSARKDRTGPTPSPVQAAARTGVGFTPPAQDNEGLPRSVEDMVTAAAQRGVHIRFPTADQAIRYIEAVLDSALIAPQDVRQRTRFWWSSRHDRSAADQLPWGVVLPTPDQGLPEVLQNTAVLHGGKFEPIPAGTLWSLNQFLERMRLRPKAALPNRLECLLILCTNQTPAAIAEVYQSFPSGQYGDCHFLLGPMVGTTRTWAIIVFNKLRSIDRVADWVRRLGGKATAFYPVGDADSVFFCQWQHLHPLAGLSRLYDLQAGSEDIRYVLMGADANTGAKPWLKIPRTVAEQALCTSETLFKLTIDDGEVEDPVVAEAGGPMQVDLPLRAYRVADAAVINATQLQRRGDALRRELADIEAKAERLDHLDRGLCHVAMVFFQDSSERLPSRFAQFLRQSYHRLSLFNYFYFSAGRRMHIVFSKVPTTLMENLASGADEIYLHDSHWQVGLRIYVRHGIDLSPRMDDPAIAKQFEQYLSQGREPSENECCLIDAPEWSNDEGGPTSRRLAIARIRGQIPLTDAIRMFNEAFEDGADCAEEQLPSASKGTQVMQRLSLGEDLKAFYQEMETDLDRRVENASRHWLGLSQRIEAILKRIDDTKAELPALESLLDRPSETWQSFVDRTLELHRRLSRIRPGCFSALRDTKEKAADKRKEVVLANAQVSALIKSANAKIDRFIRELETAEIETNAELEDLEKRKRGLDDRKQKIAEQIGARDRTISAKLTETQAQYDRLVDWRRQVAEKEKEHEELDQQVSNEKTKLTERETAVNAAMARLRECQQNLRTKEAMIAQQEQEAIGLDRRLNAASAELEDRASQAAGAGQSGAFAASSTRKISSATGQVPELTRDTPESIRSAVPTAPSTSASSDFRSQGSRRRPPNAGGNVPPPQTSASQPPAPRPRREWWDPRGWFGRQS